MLVTSFGPSVCPFVCFHSIFWTGVCACARVCLDCSSPEIESQGQTRSVWPRSLIQDSFSSLLWIRVFEHIRPSFAHLWSQCQLQRWFGCHSPGSSTVRTCPESYYGTLLLRSSSALAFRTPTCTKRARSITLAGSHPAQTQKRYRSTQRWKVTALVTTSLAAMSHTQKNRVFSALSRLRESSLLHS